MTEDAGYSGLRERNERRNAERYEDVPVISRDQFLKMFAREYQPGQHVTFLGPSGRGKTKLAGQMLIVVQRKQPNIQAYVLHGKIKGRDQTIEKLARAGKLQIISGGRPNLVERGRHRMDKHRNGYIIRPLEKPGTDIREENELLHNEYAKTIHRNYHASSKHPVILIVDEAHQTHNDLKLRTECEGPLMRGRPVCGEWSLVQRGRFVSYMVYDQAEWVLIFKDKDESNQERYSEIGGIDTRQFKYLTTHLKTYSAPDGSTYSQALLFRRSGDYLAIVDT